MLLIELIGAIIASFILAILYEGLKSLREWLLYIDVKRSKKSAPSVNGFADSNDKTVLIDATHKRPNKLVS